MSDFQEQRRQRFDRGAEYITAVTREDGQRRQAFQTTIRSITTRAQQHFAKRLINFQHHLGSVWFEMRSTLNLPKEQPQAEVARAFENAKGLADFIGMVVSLGFTVALYTFCFEQMKSTTGWIDFSAYSVAAVFFLGLSACLWFWTSSIVFHYFWEDVADNRLVWLKAITLLLLLMQCFAVTWTIYKFAETVVIDLVAMIDARTL
jgi:hypothetical protein